MDKESFSPALFVSPSDQELTDLDFQSLCKVRRTHIDVDKITGIYNTVSKLIVSYTLHCLRQSTTG